MYKITLFVSTDILTLRSSQELFPLYTYSSLKVLNLCFKLVVYVDMLLPKKASFIFLYYIFSVTNVFEKFLPPREVSIDALHIQ